MTDCPEKNIPPRIYHVQDPDKIFELWKELVCITATGERSYAELFQDLFDPDKAPMPFVELMLISLGNPFKAIILTDSQKRKLVKLLIPIYKQKGTAIGIINAVRFLLGIEIDIIDPHGVDEDGWQVGKSEIGLNTYVGGGRVYCNLLNWTEDFAFADWDKVNMSVSTDAVQGPLPWIRPADQWNMPVAGGQIEQVVEPLFVGGQTFTGSIFLRASAPVTITATIYDVDNPSDFGTEDFNVTTVWQRFSLQHMISSGSIFATKVAFQFSTGTGIADDLYAWGAQLVRNDEVQPYAQSTDNGMDCSEPDRWAYHFIIVSPVILTEKQIEIIRMIADYMKTAHTHYTIIDPSTPDADIFDHWEVEISEVGYTTFVHA